MDRPGIDSDLLRIRSALDRMLELLRREEGVRSSGRDSPGDRFDLEQLWQ